MYICIYTYAIYICLYSYLYVILYLFKYVRLLFSISPYGARGLTSGSYPKDLAKKPKKFKVPPLFSEIGLETARRKMILVISGDVKEPYAHPDRGPKLLSTILMAAHIQKSGGPNVDPK